MEWKTFDQLLPNISGCQIVVRHKTEKDIIFIAEIKHPHSVQPEKYNKNYFKILFQNDWVDVCSDVDNIFEWLDPYEDKKEKDKK